MSTPMKPVKIATMRRQPTHSPRNGPASSATMSGAMNTTEMVWSRRRWRRARKLPAVVDTMRNERSNSSLSLRVRRKAETGSTLSIDSMIRNWPRKRDHTICTTGRCACVTRYFAEVSRAEKKATARHMRPMAFRRSAAASVAARDGCAAASTRPPALAAAGSVALLSSMGGSLSAWPARRPICPMRAGVDGCALMAAAAPVALTAPPGPA